VIPTKLTNVWRSASGIFPSQPLWSVIILGLIADGTFVQFNAQNLQAEGPPDLASDFAQAPLTGPTGPLDGFVLNATNCWSTDDDGNAIHNVIHHPPGPYTITLALVEGGVGGGDSEDDLDAAEFTAKRGFSAKTGFKPKFGFRRKHGFLAKRGF
jgi:hypothetical protein